jgi:hypothetical protein
MNIPVNKPAGVVLNSTEARCGEEISAALNIHIRSCLSHDSLFGIHPATKGVVVLAGEMHYILRPGNYYQRVLFAHRIRVAAAPMVLLTTAKDLGATGKLIMKDPDPVPIPVACLHDPRGMYASITDVDLPGGCGPVVVAPLTTTTLRVGKYVKAVVDALISIAPTTSSSWGEHLKAIDIPKLAAHLGDHVFAGHCGVAEFVEVSGEDIRHYYYEKNYACPSGSGQLGSSCMRFERCQSYLDLYVNNPRQVSLAVALTEDAKVLARALIWKTTAGERIMDRIYGWRGTHEAALAKWATQNGVKANCYDSYKSLPHAGGSITVEVDEWEFDQYPYLDSLRYKRGSMLSTLEISGGLEMCCTDGGHGKV